MHPPNLHPLNHPAKNECTVKLIPLTKAAAKKESKDIDKAVTQLLKIADGIATRTGTIQGNHHRQIIGLIRRLQKEFETWTTPPTC